MKFVVISGGRCGSSLLASSLDQHPNVVCADEILHTSEAIRRKHYRRVLSDENYLRSHDPESARMWLPDFYERAGVDGARVGFKHIYEIVEMLDHWEVLGAIPDLRIVHLVRNPLMSHISFQEAKLFKPWHKPASDFRQGIFTSLSKRVRSSRDRESGRISLFPAEVALWADATLHWREKVRGMARPVFEVSYRDVHDSLQGASDKVFGFLEVGPHSVEARFEKTGHAEVRERVSNWDAFVRALPNSYRWLLDDLL